MGNDGTGKARPRPSLSLRMNRKLTIKVFPCFPELNLKKPQHFKDHNYDYNGTNDIYDGVHKISCLNLEVSGVRMDKIPDPCPYVMQVSCP